MASSACEPNPVLTVDDIDAILARAAPAGWEAVAPSRAMTAGDHAGVRFACLRDAQDGTLVKLVQPPGPGANG
ncbi:hypothetical protein KN815_30830 [Streptomyces sp. 4503]|uniref:Uncharacterized protein n=1 Tax=Streptomyces niphimycinicus TaxID=2842201 RepID=A0ABS6CN73_9ACTN|nr:hypothetical protein [Streptomyces niphimycinicus]MBU3868285.1 hypothetical protein [Streptomyces niphimycinicus]